MSHKSIADSRAAALAWGGKSSRAVAQIASGDKQLLKVSGFQKIEIITPGSFVDLHLTEPAKKEVTGNSLCHKNKR